MADVERTCFAPCWPGRPRLDATGQDPDGEFLDLGKADTAEAFATWREQVTRAREPARGRSLDDIAPRRDKDLVSRRWIAHMIEEYARHNGHADLLRERIDKVTADTLPPAPGARPTAARPRLGRPAGEPGPVGRVRPRKCPGAGHVDPRASPGPRPSHSPRSGMRQSTGSWPCALSASSIWVKGRLPRKSLADSGDGWAPWTTACRAVSISGSFFLA